MWMIDARLIRARWSIRACAIVLLTALPWSHAMPTEIIKGKLDSDIVPSPVEYALIAPDGFREMKDLPLVLSLHGGGGNRDKLIEQAPLWARLWE